MTVTNLLLNLLVFKHDEFVILIASSVKICQNLEGLVFSARHVRYSVDLCIPMKDRTGRDRRANGDFLGRKAYQGTG